MDQELERERQRRVKAEAKARLLEEALFLANLQRHQLTVEHIYKRRQMALERRRRGYKRQLAVDEEPDYKRLRSESTRLSTFDYWPSEAGRIVKPHALAKAGLFYTGVGDRVQCAYCRGFLHSWEQGDKPDDEHRKHFPNCPFVRGWSGEAEDEIDDGPN